MWSTLLLSLSGISIVPWLFPSIDFLVWIHINLGFAYTVIFILYVIDHLSEHRKLLFTAQKKNLSGSLQALAGTIVISSGFLIYLFGSKPIPPWSEIHLAATILLLLGNVLHFHSLRKWFRKKFS